MKKLNLRTQNTNSLCKNEMRTIKGGASKLILFTVSLAGGCIVTDGGVKPNTASKPIDIKNSLVATGKSISSF